MSRARHSQRNNANALQLRMQRASIFTNVVWLTIKVSFSRKTEREEGETKLARWNSDHIILSHIKSSIYNQ